MNPGGAASWGWALYAMHKFALVAERAAQLWATLAAFAFLVSGVIYLYLGRWTVTHQDYWRIYDFCLNHTWLETALRKFNHHSLFFPSFFWQADFRFFHANQLPLFLAGLALLLITASLLLAPIWRDNTVGLTAKILSTLVVIVGNFWMARAFITASGGFTCENSLVMAGAALAFLLLPTMRASSPRLLPVTLIVVCAGFVASFSYGGGLAIWPTLLLLAWGLRLPKYCVGTLAAAGLTAAIIFVLLPGQDWVSPQEPALSVPLVGYATVIWPCRLLGTPFFVAMVSWWPDKFYPALAESLELPLCTVAGAMGLILAMLAVLPPIIQRNMPKSRLEFTGLALIVFALFVTSLIVIGRADYFHGRPFEAAAPRYLFWSTLFWTGLLLVAIARAQSRQWLRWPVYLIVLALPVLIFPNHYKNGVFWRNARWRAESAATSLVNGVRDLPFLAKAMQTGTGPEMVYRVARIYHLAEQLRARRLDMFADGLQDWIGLNEANLFGGRHKLEGLKGQCRIVALAQCDNGAPAARVMGQASREGYSTPKTLVIVDPTGVVRGVARSSAPMSPFINRVFYLGRIIDHGFLGYIRDYDPQLRYAVRSADNGVLSEEKIPVQPPIPEPAKP